MTGARQVYDLDEDVFDLDAIEESLAASDWVLIVDDEVAVRQFLTRTIAKSSPGITVVQAENGQEALEALAQRRCDGKQNPALIVTDLEMPVMDGWDLIGALEKDYRDRGEPQGIPLVVLSSTTGTKRGLPLARKSVHGRGCSYSPIATVAKESCLDTRRYDAAGEKGLRAWLEFFLEGHA